MLKQTIDRLLAEFGPMKNPTKKLDKWEPRPDIGIAVEREGSRSLAQVWVPHPGPNVALPACVLEYGPTEGRHSNAYSLPGLRKGMPALRFRIETPAHLEDLLRFIRALPPIRSVA